MATLLWVIAGVLIGLAVLDLLLFVVFAFGVVALGFRWKPFVWWSDFVALKRERDRRRKLGYGEDRIDASNPSSEPDPFLRKIIEARQQARVHIEGTERNTKDDEIAVTARDESNEALRTRLSRFARSQGLDRALILVWRELSDYRMLKALGTMPDPRRLSIHKLSFDNDQVDFVAEGSRFSVKTGYAWKGAKISLYENNEEMFAVTGNVREGQRKA